MKWKAWKCSVELKFEEGILYQKWSREQNAFGGRTGSTPYKQTQWRPIPGQDKGSLPILKDGDVLTT